MAIGTCADGLLALAAAGPVTGSWVGGSAGYFHCSDQSGELFHLDSLLLALGPHLFEQRAVSVDGGGAGCKITDDGLGTIRCLECGDLLFQGCRILHHGIIFVGSTLGDGSTLGNGGCGADGWWWAALAEGICTLVPASLGLAVGSSRDDAVFLREQIPGDCPGLIDRRFPLLEKLGFEQSAVVHTADEAVDLVGIGDGCIDAEAVPLALVELAGKGGDVLVGCIAPWSLEVGFGLHLFFVGDDGPSSDVIEEGVDGFVVVADVLLLFLLEVLLVDDADDDGDAAGDDGHLEVELLTDGLLLLLHREELAACRLVRDRWVDGCWLCLWAAVEVGDARRGARFGLVEDEGEAAVVSFPLAGGEAAGDLGELGDEKLDGCRCRLADHLVEVLVSKFCPHHLGDRCAGRCCHSCYAIFF